MSKLNGFPYFQFHVDRWLTGKISAFDLDEQGFFLNLSIQAWVCKGPFNICSTTVQRRYRKPAAWVADAVNAFLDVGILQRDGEQYRIKFMDEQLDLLEASRAQRSEAGKKSAEARRLAAIENEADSKEEETREEKSRALNSRSTSVQRALDSGYPSDFVTFWEAYPKKKHKGTAFKAWKAQSKFRPETGAIVAKVVELATSGDWTKDSGQWIPDASTWINGHGWDDEVRKASKPKERGLVL